MESTERAAIVAKFRRVNDSKRVRSERKLLHWTSAQWSQFERQPSSGKVLTTVKLLPIRVPLSTLYETHLSKETTDYSPSALMESLISRSRSGQVVNVGLVIDATGDDMERHNQREWDDWDVEYLKLPTQSQESEDHQAPLSEAHEETMVEAFCAALVKHHQGPNKDRDVAVFGAKGFAFVGYLIVSVVTGDDMLRRFLVEYCGVALDQALKEFAESCPPGIYCRNYVERLYKKYFSTLTSPNMRLTIPTSPGWDPQDDSSSASASPSLPQDVGHEVLTEEDKAKTFVPQSLDFCQQRNGTTTTASPSSSGGGTPGGSQKPRFPTPRAYKPPVYTPPPPPVLPKRRKIRTWVDDVEPLEFGELIDTASDTHKKLTESLEKLTKVTGFPGCEAISLTATHVGEKAFTRKGCLTRQYLVTWRARGRRCLLWILKDATYLISRDMSFTKIDMRFPRRHSSETLTNTLLDGVLVTDRDGKVDVKRYLVFDVLFFEGKDIWQRKLEKRLSCIQNEIMQPKKHQDQLNNPANEPFRVRMKDHFRLAKTEFLLSTFVKDVTHEVDGVIYTPTDAPYNLGGFESDEPIFKFVASEGDMPSLDGTLSKRRLLEYLSTMP